MAFIVGSDTAATANEAASSHEPDSAKQLDDETEDQQRRCKTVVPSAMERPTVASLGSRLVPTITLTVGINQFTRQKGSKARLKRFEGEVIMACIVVVYVVMAFVVMGYILMAYAVMAYILMAYVGMAYIVMAYIVMAYIVMAYIVMAYIVMAYVILAYVVMACMGFPVRARARLCV